MSSLWTPGGEHTPRPEPDDPAAAMPRTPSEAGSTRAPADGVGPEELDEAQMREALAQLVATPVAAIVADHAVRLHELAVLHMGVAAERAGSLAEAALAIDGMAALVDGLGDRLGDAARPLADALAQLRLAYVQVSQEQAATE